MVRIYVGFVHVFLGNCRLSLDHMCQNLFYGWDMAKHLVEHTECLSNCEEICRGNKISWRTNILRTLRYWRPTGFFSTRNTVLPPEVPKLVLCVGSSKLNNFT